MTDDPRYEEARRRAVTIGVKAEELSTAIYEAHKMGYRTSIRLSNVVEVASGRFIGDGESSAVVNATVAFDIGRAVL